MGKSFAEQVDNFTRQPGDGALTLEMLQEAKRILELQSTKPSEPCPCGMCVKARKALAKLFAQEE